MSIRFIRSTLLVGAMLFLSTGSFAQVGVSVNFAPPTAARLRTAYLPRRRLYLDARLLGLGW